MTSAPTQRGWEPDSRRPVAHGIEFFAAEHSGSVTFDSLRGYRQLRLLGEGPRARVYLAHARRTNESAPAAPAPSPVAIKVYRAGVTASDIATEIEALTRAGGDHTQPFRDVTTADDGAHALILARLTGGSLSRLLRERRGLRLGESITLLAPLASALSRIHRAGVVHGGIRADAVLFDASGAPTIGCFGRASLIDPGQPPALLDVESGVAADVTAFANLARTVLQQVNDPGALGLAELLRADRAREPHEWLDTIAGRLFDLGEAEPIGLDSDRIDADPLVPGRLIPADPGAVAVPATIDASVEPPVRRKGEGLRTIAHRVRLAVGGVRRRFWVVVGAIALTLAAAALVPQRSSDSASPVGAGSVPTVAGQVTGAPTAPTAEEAAITGDSPVAALAVLISVRARCLRELSVLCLDAVAQAGSPAMADDRDLVRALQGGAESVAPWQFQPSGVIVRERLGDSAIVDLGDVTESQPASVLLMKGEAGWRIRDYLQR